ncbi:hypothetical protein GWI33_008896 [Rhynchophorus ferrugineus]|uniref:Guanylate kinase-like domain-containing protein n=1 Tax=Rhynchophorus ferrugineus TaxID=354439 RepID=A0A834IXZ7_RHYFE|nr:hypothetical protein GWI33_008896 [Rhynchophorus ferrugineus]
MNKPILWNWLQPYDFEPLNVIVLVGVEGSKRSFLAKKLKQICPDVDIAIPHTTRPRHEHEVEGDYFYYVDNTSFSRMIKEGQFLLHEASFGDSYGYTHAEFRKAENRTLVFYTNLIMGLALKNNFLNTKLVLTIPSTTAKLLDNLTKLYAIRAVDSAVLKVTPSPIIAEECAKRFAQDRTVFIEKEVERILSEILCCVCLNSYPGFIEDIKSNDTASLGISDHSSHQSLWDTESENGYESDTNDGLIYAKSYSDDSKTVTFTLNKNSNKDKEDDRVSGDLENSKQLSLLSTMTSDFYLQHSSYKESMADDATVRRIYDVVLKDREELLNIHWSTPGLFRELIFSDYEEEAMKKLDMIVQEFTECNIHKPILDFRKDKSMKAVIAAKVQDCFKDLMRETDISAKQAAQFCISNDRHLCLKNVCTNPACPSF